MASGDWTKPEDKDGDVSVKKEVVLEAGTQIKDEMTDLNNSTIEHEKMQPRTEKVEVKLIVKESSFNEVMRAMYKPNQSQEENPNDGAQITSETPHVISNPVSPIEGKALQSW